MEIEVKLPGDTECEVTWNKDTRTLKIRPRFFGFVPREAVVGHITVLSSDATRDSRAAALTANTGNGALKLYRVEAKTPVAAFDAPAGTTPTPAEEEKDDGGEPT